MQELTMNIDRTAGVTAVSNAFIDKYMPGANPNYSVIYLYLLRHASANIRITCEEAAEKLGLLESDVLKALNYWDKAGALHLGKSETEFDITFPRLTDGPAKPKADINVVAPAPEKKTNRHIMASRPQYTVEELEVYKKECEDIDRLFTAAENSLGKLLSFNDLSVVFGMYDWLRLPVAVIELLLEYCANNGHRSIRYIEKVAIDWAENEINTVEKVKSYIEVYNRDYREILKAFGQSRREPNQTEVGIMKKWIKEYEMPIEVIIAACDKTIMSIGQPKFAYADSILESWNAKGIRTLEAVNEAQEQYYKEKIDAAKQNKDEKKGRPNRFINFKQRQWDYDELEKLERDYLGNNVNAKVVSE